MNRITGSAKKLMIVRVIKTHPNMLNTSCPLSFKGAMICFPLTAVG